MSDTKEFTILYAEDETEIRKKYTHYLKRFCTNIYEAEDGEEAFQLYKEKRPDIVITDINMPKINGLEFVSMIRENDHHTKVIMLTAHSDRDYLLKATNLKLTNYLLKPVNREDLKVALNNAKEELLKFNVYSKTIIHLRENCHWDPTAMEFYTDNELISLTKNEKTLIGILTSKLNTTISYDEIIYEVWPDEFNDKFPALKTLVKSLRKKLPENLLENIRSIGYKIRH